LIELWVRKIIHRQPLLLTGFGRHLLTASTGSQLAESLVDGVPKPRCDCLDVMRASGVRRRDNDMITALAVDSPAARIYGKTCLQSVISNAIVKLPLGIESPFGRAIFQEFYREKKTSTAYVADVFVVPQTLAQAALEQHAHVAYVAQQILFADDALDLQRSRTCNRVRFIGVTVDEGARTGRQRIDYSSSHQNTRNRLIPAAQSFADCLNAGRYALLLPRMGCPGAAHTAHDLIEDQQGPVAIANLANGFEDGLCLKCAVAASGS
jgi:hypothetical protein